MHNYYELKKMEYGLELQAIQMDILIEEINKSDV